MAHDTAGDPVSGIKWTRRTTSKVAEQLRSAGIDVCPNTVAKLLGGLGYRLRSNAKKLNRQKDPGRHAQFAYITTMRDAFAKAGLPVVSVDSKHRELVGEFKNPGATWDQQPTPVLDHDLPSDAKGVALPYGVYDLAANQACVSVGTTHDTPDFAVDNLARWWALHGCRRYPEATELLVLADSGGSNGAHCRVWKHALQHRLCDRYGLTVTVCHYPSGASKYNPIEHRAFSQISKNWAGQPLTDYETVINYLSTTTTKTGFRVDAHLVRADYPIGVKVSDKEMNDLSLRPHDTQPGRNYTISPRSTGHPETGNLFLRQPLATVRFVKGVFGRVGVFAVRRGGWVAFVGLCWHGGSLRRTLMYRDLVGQATSFALARWEGSGVLLTAMSRVGLHS